MGSDGAGMVGLEPAGDTDAAAFVIDVLGRLGFETRSATSTFGDRELTLCTYPLVAVARTDSEVVRGIRRGLVQRILDDNAPTLGDRYTAAVFPDPQDGNCSIRLALRRSDRVTATTTARGDGEVSTGRGRYIRAGIDPHGGSLRN
ncbi:hypothetical protein [Rhodococcus phenolicus]|uniref:hypothetical protein n=1 Tax=Rhodococcus phenolicus TaxID=263849 RepID=UPI000A693426|nr:hypothetical protein [Rhodococcus phenolicus]